MSILGVAFLVACAGAVWALMLYASKHEQRHADAVGSVCDECYAWCPQGERLCAKCSRLKRARELTGERQ